jgi:hypothetical protein
MILSRDDGPSEAQSALFTPLLLQYQTLTSILSFLPSDTIILISVALSSLTLLPSSNTLDDGLDDFPDKYRGNLALILGLLIGILLLILAILLLVVRLAKDEESMSESEFETEIECEPTDSPFSPIDEFGEVLTDFDRDLEIRGTTSTSFEESKSGVPSFR